MALSENQSAFGMTPSAGTEGVMNDTGDAHHLSTPWVCIYRCRSCKDGVRPLVNLANGRVIERIFQSNRFRGRCHLGSSMGRRSRIIHLEN